MSLSALRLFSDSRSYLAGLRLERKICEHEYCQTEADAKLLGEAPEARAVFICSELNE
jgi:hypothetical protein